MELEQQGEEGQEQEVFPQLKELYKRNLVFKMITFVSLLLIIGAVFLNLLLPGSHAWMYIIMAAVGCFWIVFYIAFRKRRNVEKAILYTEVLISMLCRMWDYAMGNLGWSIDYVIPILGMVILVVLFFISRFLHHGEGDDLIYQLLGGLLGIVPLVFYALHMLHTPVPSLLCAAFSIIFLTAVLVFQGDHMLGEIQRRMHV